MKVSINKPMNTMLSMEIDDWLMFWGHFCALGRLNGSSMEIITRIVHIGNSFNLLVYIDAFLTNISEDINIQLSSNLIVIFLST